jgi:hypothetical protein
VNLSLLPRPLSKDRQVNPFRLLIVLIGLLSLAVACTARQSAVPTVPLAEKPDSAATETAIARNIFATLTAAPTATPPPSATVVPLAEQDKPTIAPTTAPTTPPPAVSTPAPTSQPPSKPTVPATTTPSGPVAVVKSATLNVRAGPGTGHAVVAAAKHGDSLKVTGRNTEGNWLEVSLIGGQKGWVSASLVQLTVPVETVDVAGLIPTSPAPGPTRQPPAGARDLEVSFINPHYDCMQGELVYTGDDGQEHPLWGYRYFQVDMFIKNNGSAPLAPPWRVSRWIITDGQKDVVSGLVWQWVSGRGDFYKQPTIQSGQSAGWTFIGFPVDRNQWVKAVEFVRNGQVYRQEFDLGTFRNNYNYQDCSEPRPHTDRPTPTPRP